LTFWQKEIDAIIKEIHLADHRGLARGFRNIHEITGTKN
jgi:hypothetical protein